MNKVSQEHIENARIANTIVQQLCGGGTGRLKALIGAKDFVAIDHGLQFGFNARGKDNIGKVRIILTPMDDYRVEFYARTKVIRLPELVKMWEGIYADQLQGVFESTTGLFVSFVRPE